MTVSPIPVSAARAVEMEGTCPMAEEDMVSTHFLQLKNHRTGGLSGAQQRVLMPKMQAHHAAARGEFYEALIVSGCLLRDGLLL